MSVASQRSQSNARVSRPDAALSTATPRLHWIDWLRVAAIVGVFVFHTLRPFDATDWHVKNGETNDLIGASQLFFSTFGLAVFFLLAGAGVQFALRKRNWRTFVGERFARLLVPFVVGTLLLSPLQAHIEATAEGTTTEALPDFVGWWSSAPGAILGEGISPTVFGFGYHLWFLGFLFAFAIVGLPMCLALRGRRGMDAIAALASRVAARFGSTLGFAVPIAVLLLVLAPLGTGEHDWAEFGQFFAYYLVGYVLLADERFLAAVHRDVWLAVVVAVMSTVALLSLDFFEWVANETSRGLDPRSLAIALLFVLEGWCSTLVVLNIGLRLAQLQRPVSQRIGDAVLPVYIIHQPVILAVAIVVVQWPLGILPKWISVFGISAVVTLALVELALRTPVTRVLLGARTQPSTAIVQRQSRTATAGPAGVQPAVGSHHARPG